MSPVSTPDGVDRSGEQTFADVLNGLSPSPRRLRGIRVENAAALPEIVLPDDEDDEEENASSVRAYTWTGGRTSSDVQLEIETLVSADERAMAMVATLRTEHQSVIRLCERATSVAEVAALLHLPLGVARVLLGDMAALGLIIVHGSASDPDDGPDLALLQRVLRGLTNLRPAPAEPVPTPEPVNP
jgi:uncharacterized protein DUF742